MLTAPRLAGLATVLLMLVFCAPASAANFIVDNGGDGNDRNPGDGICDGSPNGDPAFCTLRAAVEEANALEGEDLIDVQVDVVQLTLGGTLGAIEISTDMAIEGQGAESTYILQEVPQFSSGDRVFDITAPGAKVALRRLQIANGEANQPNGHFGGNIRSSGILEIEDSTITNGSGDSAGGIANTGGTLTLIRSTVHGNRAVTGGGDAGAILNFGIPEPNRPAVLNIHNSTIANNTANLGGGVFSYNNAQNEVHISNSTIAYNESGFRGSGGGLAIGSGLATVSSSIIARNTSASPANQNCSVDPGAILDSGGYNLEDQTDCGFTKEGDEQDVDAGLDELSFNGGETPTIALLSDSPARDSGPVECPADDQRGESRPKGLGCDKGAFEADPPPYRDIASAGPVDHIFAGNDLRCQAHYEGDQEDSFFGGRPGSCGTRIRFDDVTQELAPVEQSAVTGSGTRSDPFKVVTTVDTGGDSGITLTQTDTYVVGDDFYRSDVTVSNDGLLGQSALLWHWADCYLQDNDLGFGHFDSSTGGIYCSASPNNSPPARIEGFVPVSPGSQWFEGSFSNAASPPDGGYTNTCLCDTEVDNGMGLSWNIVVPGQGSVTRSFLTAFSPSGNLVDTTPPNTEITGGPDGQTNDSTPTFNLSSSEAGSTFECSVDGGAFAACGSPHTTAPLGDGAHTLRVRATDASGNVDASPAERAFTVDTSPPDTAMDGGPTGPTDDNTPTFSFSAPEPGSRFECSIDDGPYGPCSSPFTTGNLPAGKHTLAVRAVDGAGNADPTPSVFGFEIQAETVDELPDPKPGVTINVQEVAGTVLIGIPSSAAAARSGHASQKGIEFVPLSQAEQIPVGSFLDTRRGTVRLQSALNAAGDRQTGDFLSSIFQVRQSKRRSARGLTDLVLKGGTFNRCGAARGKRGKRASASLSRRTIRRLRANAQGRFRTSGRNSSATVRGTRWETIDRCDGTLTKVQRGTVVVRDFRKKKNVVLKAGKSYLARAKR